ncbi:hypothetical protein SXCC_00038 [Gluconacetobacter sp. SXCC-1]|nr:hypothetical protein SXCC_00038 [Gluconacetobacter sp. SXCC-1]
MHVFPVSETVRKIAPRDAGAIAIQHGFHEQTVVRSRATDMTLPTGQKIFYPLPLVVAQAVTSHSSVSLKNPENSQHRTPESTTLTCHTQDLTDDTP